LIEVAQSTTGLLLIHVRGKERVACEAAHNRFLLSHGLREWDLIVRTNLVDQSLVAQSINPTGKASPELVIAQASDIRSKLTDLLETELGQWSACSSASQASEGARTAG